MNVYARIAAAAARHGDRPALIEQASRGPEPMWTYAEFDLRVRRLCAWFDRQGIGSGDRVIVLIPMQRELYVCMAAAIRQGAVTVFLDPHMPAADLDNSCRLVEARAFIGVPKAHLLRLRCPHLRRVPSQLSTGRLPWLCARYLGAILEDPHAESSSEIAEVSADHPALIGFTTGSSGAPRGSTRTHGFLHAQIAALFQPEQKRSATSDLPGFPVLPLDNLVQGRTSVLPRIPTGAVAKVDAAAVIEQARVHRPDMMSGSPAYLATIAEAAIASGVTFDSPRVLFTGGAGIGPAQLQTLRAVWPNARVIVVYGSTEAEPVASIDAVEILEACQARTRRGHGYCVGYPIEQIDVCVLPFEWTDDANQALEAAALPPGQIGEFVVRGAHVNTRYWNDPEGEQNAKIPTPAGIWHRMGDAGYRDEAGRLWLVGRRHSAIANPLSRPLPAPLPAPLPDKAGDDAREGQLAVFDPHAAAWLFPYQVEAIVNELPGVRRSAYLDAGDGHHLVVELDAPGLAPERLKPELEAALAGFPLTKIWFRALPVDARHNAKIQYAAVRRWLEEQLQ